MEQYTSYFLTHVGIAGSYAFPPMRSCAGLTRTGLIALGLQLAALAPCVASIWLPGSPFAPITYFRDAFAVRSVGYIVHLLGEYFLSVLTGMCVKFGSFL